MRKALTGIEREAEHRVEVTREEDLVTGRTISASRPTSCAAVREAGARVGDIEAYFRKRAGRGPGCEPHAFKIITDVVRN